MIEILMVITEYTQVRNTDFVITTKSVIAIHYRDMQVTKKKLIYIVIS
jgi:hypothetical protein